MLTPSLTQLTPVRDGDQSPCLVTSCVDKHRHPIHIYTHTPCTVFKIYKILSVLISNKIQEYYNKTSDSSTSDSPSPQSLLPSSIGQSAKGYRPTIDEGVETPLPWPVRVDSLGVIACSLKPCVNRQHGLKKGLNQHICEI